MHEGLLGLHLKSRIGLGQVHQFFGGSDTLRVGDNHFTPFAIPHPLLGYSFQFVFRLQVNDRQSFQNQERLEYVIFLFLIVHHFYPEDQHIGLSNLLLCRRIPE